MFSHPKTVGPIVCGHESRNENASCFFVQSPQSLNITGLGDSVNSLCRNATHKDIDDATFMADGGWLKGSLKRDTIRAFLRQLIVELEAIKVPWIHAAHLSTGLPLSPRLDDVEWKGMISQIRLAIELLIPEFDFINEGDLKMALDHYGIGPAVCMGPINFPLRFSSVVGTHALMNWMAGNPVIAKPHPALTVAEWYPAMAVVRALEKVGMPDWVFSFLPGESGDVANLLLGSNYVNGIYFTGSRTVGDIISRQILRRESEPRLCKEVGAPNVWFVGKSSLLSDESVAPLAQKIFSSATMAAGAFCTQADILVIEKCARAQALIDTLTQLFKNAPPQLCLSRRMKDLYEAQMNEVLKISGIASLAKSCAELDLKKAHVHAQLLSVTEMALRESPLARSEHFGPVMKVIVVSDLMESLYFMPRQNLVVAVEASDDQLRKMPGFRSALPKMAGRIVLRKAPTGVIPCQWMWHATPNSAFTASGIRTFDACVGGRCWDGWDPTLIPKIW